MVAILFFMLLFITWRCYLPSQPPLVSVLTAITAKLTKYLMDNVLLLGDFNMVMDPGMDSLHPDSSTAGENHPSDPQLAAKPPSHLVPSTVFQLAPQPLQGPPIFLITHVKPLPSPETPSSTVPLAPSGNLIPCRTTKSAAKSNIPLQKPHPPQ